MKHIVLFVILVLSFFMVGAVNAQDNTENPNENACYEGGALEGKCGVFTTDEENKWAWNCGYYYAGSLKGSIDFDEVPEACHSLIGKQAVTPFSLCAELDFDAYVWIQGVPNQPGNATFYEYGITRSTSPCDELEGSGIPVIWMQTPDYVDFPVAMDMCAEADPSHTWTYAYQLEHPALAKFNWFCIVND